MGNPNVCKKNHPTNSIVSALPSSQRLDGRHRCAHCAYEEGMAAGYRKALTEVNEMITKMRAAS